MTTSYIYDSSGRRLIAKNANKTTLYLPDGTELEKIGAANPLGQRYYGPAVRDAAGLKWIIANHQGTGTAQIDAVTLTVNRRRSMPFGEPRGTQPTWLGSKGYVGGTKDDTGLTHLGAREYDPTAGRFISVDPIMDLSDPQQWNAYTYANSNPTTWSDPSGEIPCGDDDCHEVAIPKPGGGYTIKGTSKSSTGACAISIECEPLPGLTWDPPGGGGGPWVEYIPYIIEMAGRTGLDPKLLLANFIIESHRCMSAGNAICGAMQSFQKNMTNPWWALATPLIPIVGYLAGQGDKASIGYANFEKQIFETTRGNHPELAGRQWSELITDAKLNIEAMAYHMQDLAAALPAQLNTTYSRHELVRFGYRAGQGNMTRVATGAEPMGQESVANNQMYLSVYAQAGRWIDRYNASQCRSGSCGV